jgi:hypothetical protein
MKYAIQQVMDQFEITEEAAKTVVDYMANEYGLDFSECSSRTFKIAAREGLDAYSKGWVLA